MSAHHQENVRCSLQGIVEYDEIDVQPEVGMQLMADALAAEPQHKGDLSGIVLERHNTAAGFRVLSQSIRPLIEAIVYTLSSSNFVGDVAYLSEEPMPGMFPLHPDTRPFDDRFFYVVPTPIHVKRGAMFATHADAFTPDGPLGLQGIVVEKVDRIDGGPIIRLHLSIFDGELRWYTIDTSGVMTMTKYGSAVGMTAFINMGLFFNTEPMDRDRENRYTNIDLRIAIERKEQQEEPDDMFTLLPQWLPLLPQVIRDTIDLNAEFAPND